MIDGYKFGQMTIEGKDYTFDLMVFHDPAAPAGQKTRIRENWRRIRGHELNPGDIQEILAFKPECAVIGRGAYGVMSISEEAAEALADAGIEAVFQETQQACSTFNNLFGKKKIAAGFHLTC
jgi:hypothetical protein